MQNYYATLHSDLEKARTLHSQMVGVHIRMQTDIYGEIGQKGDIRANFDMAIPFRLSCHWSHFARALHKLDEAVGDANKSRKPRSILHVFLSTDSTRAIDGIAAVTNVHSLPFCPNRNTTCMQIAAASIILLSQAQKLLLSRWSAFSEVAARAGSHPFDYSCDEPTGGWKLASGKEKDLRLQVEAYLGDQLNYRNPNRSVDKAVILAAFDRRVNAAQRLASRQDSPRIK